MTAAFSQQLQKVFSCFLLFQTELFLLLCNLILRLLLHVFVVFGRPFVKWFALCYRTVVLSVCLSVCLSTCLSVCL